MPKFSADLLKQAEKVSSQLNGNIANIEFVGKQIDKMQTETARAD